MTKRKSALHALVLLVTGHSLVMKIFLQWFKNLVQPQLARLAMRQRIAVRKEIAMPNRFYEEEAKDGVQSLRQGAIWVHET